VVQLEPGDVLHRVAVLVLRPLRYTVNEPERRAGDIPTFEERREVAAHCRIRQIDFVIDAVVVLTESERARRGTAEEHSGLVLEHGGDASPTVFRLTNVSGWLGGSP
jgi:hypothetical protein